MISKAGKDKGKWYVVVSVDFEEERLLVCDGVRRSLNRPKKKNPIHLQFTNYYLDSIREKLIKGEKILDSEIKEGLRELTRERGGV